MKDHFRPIKCKATISKYKNSKLVLSKLCALQASGLFFTLQGNPIYCFT